MDSRAAYMREYRRKQKLGIPTHRRPVNHEACDQRIADLQRQVDALTEDNKKLREALPF